MRKAKVWTAAAVLLISGANAMADQESTQLVGVYSITSGEKFGLTEPPEKVANHVVRFTADRVVVVDENDKEVYASTYTIDSSTKPWKITMTTKLPDKEDMIAKGLIEKDGDTVKLIYALPGGEAPKAFKTGEKQLMFIMKPQKK